MKKTLILGSILTALPLVSAQSFPAPPIAFNGLFDMFNSLLNNATSGSYSDIIARMLIFVLLAVVLHRPATKIVGGNGKIGALISSIIAIMAIRFMAADMIRGMFLPYETLGIVLSIAIPFALFEYFLVSSELEGPFRTAGYFMMAGIFTGMWFFRWTDIGDLAYYYLGATILCLIALSFDNTLKNWMVANRIGNAKKRQAYISSIGLETQLKKAIEDYAVAQPGTPQEKAVKAQIEGIEKALEKLNRI